MAFNELKVDTTYYGEFVDYLKTFEGMRIVKDKVISDFIQTNYPGVSKEEKEMIQREAKRAFTTLSRDYCKLKRLNSKEYLVQFLKSKPENDPREIG